MEGSKDRSGTEPLSIDIVDSVQSRTLRQRAYAEFCQNPQVTPKLLCSKLRISYHDQGSTVRTYLWQFRCQYENRLTPYTPKILPHRRIFVWDGLERSKEAQNKAFGHGWVQSRNRNRALLFRDPRGSVQWHSNGRVVLYVQGPSNLGRAKELFCRAFSWFSDRELDRLTSGVLHESSRHWVFRIGEPLPRFDIRAFERSHGLHILTDGSHPDSVEVIETEPLYLQGYHHLMDQLAQDIKAHLNLIREWQKEARRARIRRSARAKKARKDRQ